MRTGLILTFALGIALAQTPPPPQPPNPPQPPQPGAPRIEQQQDIGALRSYLGLTDAQMAQMRRAGEQARRELEEKAKTIGPQMREKQMALEDLLAKDTSDAAAVGRLMLDIRAMERQMRNAEANVRQSQLGVLTPEQRARFRAIEDAANLPRAARGAMEMGLVPRPPNPPGGLRPVQPPRPPAPPPPPREN